MSNRPDRIRDIFVEAVEISPENRDAFLDQACSGDAGLRADVERLIRAEADASSSLSTGQATRVSPAPRFSPGKELAGRFRVVRFIKSGGMGDVYEVEDLELHERVALKTIQPDESGHVSTLSRFKREIQYAKRVTHPNVCRIHDLGTHLEGTSEILFLTMELLHGETLAERLSTVGRLTPGESLPLIIQMAEALSAAHEAGIIHRDFKPSNVILANYNTGWKAVVTDFGLARSSSSPEISLTETGNLVGTLVYMAPEQMTGGELTPATDVYALGLVIYEMLTGRRPFPGTALESALKRLTEPPPSPSEFLPGLDSGWETVILRCLEREPGRRFQNSQEVVRALTTTPAPTKTLTSRMLLRLGQKARSRAAIVFVAGLVLLLAAIAGLWFLGRHRPSASAMRWYEEGTRALRDGTSFTAMNALERAVQSDPDFRLAHARLAEAASDLDYMEKAKSEMLRASPPAFPSLFQAAEERLRLEAVYFGLVKDFAGAAAKYKELAAKVGTEERAGVLVDLGRAYEKAGKVQDALASYTESIKLDNQFAAAFLRRAVLEGRQQQSAKAVADFDAAEQLYRTKGKAEGLTEVLYQRSSLLRQAGKFAEARAPTLKSLAMARESGDEYHQIRALLSLSEISYRSGDTEEGQQQAQQAIDLARREGIEVLAASGLVDVGNALFNKGDNAGAEPYLRNALETAKRFQAVRVQARAEVTLGQVLVNEGHTQEALTVAKQASEDFQQSGEKNNAARAAIPVARILRDQGAYEESANLFRQQLQLAEQVQDQLGAAFAAQGLGSVLLIQEQYSAALITLDRSAEVSRSLANQSIEAYSHLYRGDALWRLGKYAEAEERLKNAEGLAQRMNGNKPLIASVSFSRAGMDLSRRRLREAEEDIHRMLDAAGPGPYVGYGKRLLGLVRIATGHAREGRMMCEESAKLARDAVNTPVLKNAELALAEAKLYSGDTAGAVALASDLVEYFAGHGQNESELRALALAISASRGADRLRYAENAKRGVEKLRQNLGVEQFRGFVSRPDIRQILQRSGLASDMI